MGVNVFAAWGNEVSLDDLAQRYPGCFLGLELSPGDRELFELRVFNDSTEGFVCVASRTDQPEYFVDGGLIDESMAVEILTGDRTVLLLEYTENGFVTFWGSRAQVLMDDWGPLED